MTPETGDPPRDKGPLRLESQDSTTMFLHRIADLEATIAGLREQLATAEGYAKSEGDAIRLLDKGNASLRANVERLEAQLAEANRIVADCAADYEMWGSAEELSKQLAEAHAGRESAEAEAERDLDLMTENRDNWRANFHAVELELAAAAEREAGLALMLFSQCRGCREGDALLENYSTSGHQVHVFGWVCPFTATERAALAAYRAAHPDAGRHGPNWIGAPSELPQ